MGNLKVAIRLLFKTPIVTLVAVLSLALGIGANSAVFSLVDQILLRPLPVVEPSELVNFRAEDPNPGSQSCSQIGSCRDVFSWPMLTDLQREQQVFTGIAAHVNFGANLSTGAQTVSGEGMLVSGSYFGVLGLVPTLGRLIAPDDAKVPGDGPVAVLSYDYWRGSFGGSNKVLEQNITVNGQSFRIIGVAPRGFSSTSLGVLPKVFVPITQRATMIPGWEGFENRRSYWIYLFARLKPDVSLAQASASINSAYSSILSTVEVPLQKGMSAPTMAKFKAKKLLLEPGSLGQSAMRGQTSTPLIMLFGITALVLLIACANIANLLLARGAARAGEMAVRLAIGGTRGQLLRQLLTESLLLGVIGGLVGLGVAAATLRVMTAILPASRSAAFVPHLDLTVIAFTAILAVVTTVLFGLFPALHATRPDLISAIREQGGQPAGGRGAARWRTALATLQMALAMALLGSAGLFAKSLAKVTQSDLGVQTEQLVTFGVSPELNGYTPERSRDFFLRLEEALAESAGVSSVGATLVPLIAGLSWNINVGAEGYPKGPDVDRNTGYNRVSPDYFRTVGIPLISGRAFTARDVTGAPKVAIVNQAFARKFKLGNNPVGRRVDQGNDSLNIEIVGLMQDAKYSDVKAENPPVILVPYLQSDDVGALTYYVRASGDPLTLMATINRVVRQLDKDLPVERLKTMPEQVRENIFLDRFVSILSAAFALLATILAAVGLYGVLSYTVAQRTREFGVRMALGASPGRVLRLVLRQVGIMTIIGAVIGLGAAVGLGRLAQSLLYQMDGANAIVLAAAAGVLGMVALAAGLVPAYRASQLDPVRALRND